MYLLGRGREGEREGEKHGRERETLMGRLLHAPSQGRPSTQARALTGNHTSDLALWEMMPNQRSHTSQGKTILKRKEKTGNVKTLLKKKFLNKRS